MITYRAKLWNKLLTWTAMVPYKVTISDKNLHNKIGLMVVDSSVKFTRMSHQANIIDSQHGVNYRWFLWWLIGISSCEKESQEKLQNYP